MKKAHGLIALGAVVTAALFQAGDARQSQSRARSDSVTILLTLGLQAREADRWDGSVRLSGGTLHSIEGRHFSAEDTVAPSGTWKCAVRRDEVAPYADLHYTEMRPGSRPEVLYHPVGVYLTLAPTPATRVAIETAQGSFDFSLPDVLGRPLSFLGGRASAMAVPTCEKLSTVEFEDDEPAMLALPGGSLAVAWVAYRDRSDRIFVRSLENNAWTDREEATPRPGDIFRCSLAHDEDGHLWVLWSEREGNRWHLWARQRKGRSWQAAERLSGEGSNTFHRAATGPAGEIFVVWQSFRDSQSDIYLRKRTRGSWSPEMKISDSQANDWEPAVATGTGGTAYFAWDSYEKGNYDVLFRSLQGEMLSPIRAVAASPRFEAHASLAVDPQNRPWIAWDEGGVNWGKDQGFLIATPLAVPLHKERWVRLAYWEGSRWMEPHSQLPAALPPTYRENSEHPQIAFDGKGGLQMIFRHWTRRSSRAIGSPQVWENFWTRLESTGWSAPRPVPNSGGSIEKIPSMTRDTRGDLWSAWMADGRPFSTMVPGNAEIYAARLEAADAVSSLGDRPLTEPLVEAIPVHSREREDVSRIRSYAFVSGGKRYRIFRGDMHRHTDVSADFKYDGSLIEVYRYGLDAAGFDYIAPTDHQTGFDQEFTWWQNQKLVDLFSVSGVFAPLFAYERSLRYPNGHRNIVFAHRGVRTFPIPPDEAAGTTGAARLFEHLRQNRGISMPHSSATAQGTDWRDNDPEVEPLIEIYQGYRTSYEYEGAPRAASRINPQAQKSGWQPEGFWWKALEKGYKLGVQASSDHWSTHISYACLISEELSREGLMDAIRRRHAYAATDNIILDFQARSSSGSFIMGDSFSSDRPPQLNVGVIGTGEIRQIDLIRNQKFIYSARPGAKEAAFQYVDQEIGRGESYYYVRVMQEDGQLAWSSPIWIRH